MVETKNQQDVNSKETNSLPEEGKYWIWGPHISDHKGCDVVYTDES
jgi:hypothetical protein